MTSRRWISILTLALLGLALLLPVIWPRIDLVVSGLFYVPDQGFVYAKQPFLVFLHDVAHYGARILFVYLVLAAFAAFLRHGPFLGIDTKGWIFLALALLLGPGLVANAILKDHWGRARPREVIEFGGQATFSPAVIPQPDARRNGSFISGDGAFGFYLPAFAYVVPKRQSRRFLSGGIALGFVFGMTRIVMGAHFLSDVAFAALFMFAVAAALHAAMFGRRNTADLWREWIDIS